MLPRKVSPHSGGKKRGKRKFFSWRGEKRKRGEHRCYPAAGGECPGEKKGGRLRMPQKGGFLDQKQKNPVSVGKKTMLIQKEKKKGGSPKLFFLTGSERQQWRKGKKGEDPLRGRRKKKKAKTSSISKKNKKKKKPRLAGGGGGEEKCRNQKKPNCHKGKKRGLRFSLEKEGE